MKTALKPATVTPDLQGGLKVFRPMDDLVLPPRQSATNPSAERQREPTLATNRDSETREIALRHKGMLQMFDQGMRVTDIYRAFNLTNGKGRATLLTARRERVANFDFDFIDSAEFHKRNCGEKILSASWEEEKGVKRKAPSGLPPYLATLYDNPLLSKEQEQVLFRRLNYDKFCAARIISKNGRKELPAEALDSIEPLMQSADHLRNILVERNLRLVVSIAKKFTSGESLFSFIAAANVHLITAVNKFDYSRGYKFSTYATWVIKKNMLREYQQDMARQSHFPLAGEDYFSGREDKRGTASVDPALIPKAREIILEAASRIDSREREILLRRSGLWGGVAAQTLEEVGAVMGVTKERVRQIEGRARKNLATALLEVPENKEILSRLGAREESLDAIHQPNFAEELQSAQQRSLKDPIFQQAIFLSSKYTEGFTMADLRSALLMQGETMSSLATLWMEMRALIVKGMILPGPVRRGVPHYYVNKQVVEKQTADEGKEHASRA